MTLTKAQIAERHTPEEINALAEQLQHRAERRKAAFDDTEYLAFSRAAEMLRAYALSLAPVSDGEVGEIEKWFYTNTDELNVVDRASNYSVRSTNAIAALLRLLAKRDARIAELEGLLREAMETK